MQQAPAKVPGNSIQPTQPQRLIRKPPRGLRSSHLSLHADQQSIIGVSKCLGALPALLRRGCSTLQRVDSTSGDSPGAWPQALAAGEAASTLRRPDLACTRNRAHWCDHMARHLCSRTARPPEPSGHNLG